MIKFLRQRNEKTGPQRGIGLTRRELAKLLLGHTLVVRGCSRTGVPDLHIIGGADDENLQKRVSS